MELRGSEEFMDAVKFNIIELVKQILARSIMIIWYNLYWAAKLGYSDLLKIIVQYSKIINPFDRELRTPLFLAALNNHKKWLKYY